MGVNMHVSMNVNFLHELLRASSWQQGYLEAIRESMGIMSFFMVGMLVGRSEPRTSALMLGVTGAGLAAYSLIASIPQLIACSLLWSFGFHIWAPLSGSMQLTLARKGAEGRTLGMIGAVGSTGVLIALGGVYLLKKYAGFGMREMFLIGGTLTALGALPLLVMPEIRAGSVARMPLSRALEPGYRLYCALEFLDGMRKQIFILFAVLALVREYGVQVQTIAALMFVNQVLCLAASPAAGWLVDRVGERRVLTVYFGILAVIYLLYAGVRSVPVLYVIFVLDNLVWTLRVGITTYANRIVPARERSQLLALGMTVNHVGAVAFPVIGGILYSTLGYRFPFFVGSVIAIGSLLVARRVPDRPGLSDGMTGLTIRPYSAADLDALEKLWEAALGNTWPVEPAALKERLGTGRHLVGERDGKVVGFVGTQTNGENGSIMAILVRPDLQRAGIGSALLDSALALMKDGGVRSVGVGAGGGANFWSGVPTNLPGALAFFEKHGWKYEETLCDMTADLAAYSTPAGIVDRMREQGVTIAQPGARDAADLLAYEQADFPYWADFMKERLDRGEYFAILAARDRDGMVCGTVFVDDPAPDFAWKRIIGSVGELGCLGVAERYEGRGIGTALSARVNEVLRSRGVKRGYLA